jgi:hypothetical protein
MGLSSAVGFWLLLRTKKKAPSFDETLFLVEYVQSNWNQLLSQLNRWKGAE